ncbi:hypothetical protein Btru_050898 [Bulinus truncatus]|nr:hypothetical protein Btru_050898 [Bulinus truncatus]
MSPGEYGTLGNKSHVNENGSTLLADIVSSQTATPTENEATYLGANYLGSTHPDDVTRSSLSTDKENLESRKSWITICGLNKKGKLLVILFGSAAFFHMTAFSLLAPFFPQEARLKGLSSTVTGLVFSTFMFVSFVISPVYGSYLSSIGGNFMVSAGLSVGGICAILFGTLQYCPKGSALTALCFLTRMTEALGLAAFSTASFAVVSSQFTNVISTIFGTLEAVKGAGFMIGPALGGVLYHFGGFGLPFYVIGSCIVLNGLILLAFLPKTEYSEFGSKNESKARLFTLKSSKICLVLFCVFLNYLGAGFLDLNLSLHMEQLGISAHWIGLVFSLWSVIYCCFTPLIGWLSDKKNLAVPELIVGHLISSMGYFFIGSSSVLHILPSTLWPSLVGVGLMGVGEACILIPSMKCMVEGARSLGYADNLETFGILSGLYQSAYSLGAFMGPFLGGLLTEKTSFIHTAEVYSVLFLLNAFILLAYFGIKSRRHKKTDVKNQELTDLAPKMTDQ